MRRTTPPSARWRDSDQSRSGWRAPAVGPSADYSPMRHIEGLDTADLVQQGLHIRSRGDRRQPCPKLLRQRRKFALMIDLKRSQRIVAALRIIQEGNQRRGDVFVRTRAEHRPERGLRTGAQVALEQYE